MLARTPHRRLRLAALDTRLWTHDARRPPRRGFTLVELLVAVAIFAVLVTITITAFRETDQDRAVAGAQQLRSMIEGARSRAIHDGQVRGIRLLLDPSNPRMVTSLVYIGAPSQYRGTLSLPLGPDGYPGGPGDDDGDSIANNKEEYGWTGSDDAIKATAVTGPTRTWLVRDYNQTGFQSPWFNLAKRALLVDVSTYAGARIKIPDDGAHWFPIISVDSTSSSNYVEIEFAGKYPQYGTRDHDNNASTSNQYYAAVTSTAPIGYLLELAPPVLPGSTPKTLANGIAIDLSGSKLPSVWRSDNTKTKSMNPTDYWTDDTYSTHMDILFTPRGDVTGTAAAAGVLHFVIADVEDIQTDSRYVVADNRHPVLQSAKPDRIVTLFTRTGLVTTSVVNHFNSSQGPYEFALAGKDAPR